MKTGIFKTVAAGACAACFRFSRGAVVQPSLANSRYSWLLFSSVDDLHHQRIDATRSSRIGCQGCRLKRYLGPDR